MEFERRIFSHFEQLDHTRRRHVLLFPYPDHKLILFQVFLQLPLYRRQLQPYLHELICLFLLRLRDEPIRVRSHIREPDYVIVQDATISKEVDIEQGLKPDGAILINTDKDVRDLGIRHPHAFAISADNLARRILGRPIINTALLGVFAGFSRELSLESVLKAVQSKFPGELGEKNARVVMESYHRFVGEVS